MQGVGCRDGGAWLDLLECRSRSSLTYEMGFVLPAQRKPKSISHTPPAARNPPLNGVQLFGGALRLCVKWRRVEAVRLRAICPDAIKSVQTPTGQSVLTPTSVKYLSRRQQGADATTDCGAEPSATLQALARRCLACAQGMGADG